MRSALCCATRNRRDSALDRTTGSRSPIAERTEGHPGVSVGGGVQLAPGCAQDARTRPGRLSMRLSARSKQLCESEPGRIDSPSASIEEAPHRLEQSGVTCSDSKTTCPCAEKQRTMPRMPPAAGIKEARTNQIVKMNVVGLRIWIVSACYSCRFCPSIGYPGRGVEPISVWRSKAGERLHPHDTTSD